MTDVRETAAQLDDHSKLMLAAGTAIMDWALIEYELALMFQEHCGLDVDSAKVLWGSIINTDARLTMLQRMLRHRMKGGDELDDFDLVAVRIRRQTRLRNEIAHATLVYRPQENAYTLVPFMVPATEYKYLSLKEVHDRSWAFGETAAALHNVRRRIGTTEEPVPIEVYPLLVELRAEHAALSKADSDRQKTLNQVEKLKAAGKWPPA